jgi:hypothetical protein
VLLLKFDVPGCDPEAFAEPNNEFPCAGCEPFELKFDPAFEIWNVAPLKMDGVDAVGCGPGVLAACVVAGVAPKVKL